MGHWMTVQILEWAQMIRLDNKLNENIDSSTKAIELKIFCYTDSVFDLLLKLSLIDTFQNSFFFQALTSET